MNIKNGMTPLHPGEILRDELDALGLSANALVEGAGCARESNHGDP